MFSLVFYVEFFFIYISKKIFSRKKTLYIEEIKEPLLGPKNLKEYVYVYRNNKFRVILDEEVTTFDVFSNELETLQRPSIPNRALLGKNINIDIFNEYMGPFCDFHSKCTGVYVPYSIDFWLNDICNQLKKCVYITDSNGNKKCFVFMKKMIANNWVSDCLKM